MFELLGVSEVEYFVYNIVKRHSFRLLFGWSFVCVCIKYSEKIRNIDLPMLSKKVDSEWLYYMRSKIMIPSRLCYEFFVDGKLQYVRSHSWPDKNDWNWYSITIIIIKWWEK